MTANEQHMTPYIALYVFTYTLPLHVNRSFAGNSPAAAFVVQTGRPTVISSHFQISAGFGLGVEGSMRTVS